MPKVKNSLWRSRSFGQIAFHILEVMSTASCSLLAPFGAPVHTALFNPKTTIFGQKRHPHTGKLSSEMPGTRSYIVEVFLDTAHHT